MSCQIGFSKSCILLFEGLILILVFFTVQISLICTYICTHTQTYTGSSLTRAFKLIFSLLTCDSHVDPKFLFHC